MKIRRVSMGKAGKSIDGARGGWLQSGGELTCDFSLWPKDG
jgi:hypothetical protein